MNSLLEEKKEIQSDLFINNFIKDLKINDNNFPTIESLENKLLLGLNYNKIESIITMYENKLLPKL